MAGQSEGAGNVDFGRMASKFGLCLVYVLFAYAHIVALRDDGFRLSVALLVVFETVMIAMIFFRRDSTEVDFSLLAVAAGLIGSFAALGFRPAGDGQDVLIGQMLQVIGVVFQLGAAFSLGRSFGLVPANRGIKTGGLYRFVRHPFYFSYIVTEIGYIISNPSSRNVFVLMFGVAFQVIRIRYEERLLLRSTEYSAYASTVRWHLVPGVW